MVLQIAPEKTNLKISWEVLPKDFELPDDPVENIQQPLLAAALTDALGTAKLIKPEMLIVSNFALVANVNGATVATDNWFNMSRLRKMIVGGGQ